MIQPSTTLDPPRTGNGVRAYPRMFPQWVLEIFRPIVGFGCRIFWRVRWTNVENIPTAGGVIIASNHQTYLDPFWISVPLKRPVRYLAWDAAFSWPIVGWLIQMLGSWPLPLEGTDPKPIRQSLQWVREGGAVVIFPEGGRGASDGTMRKFKPGAVRMALEAGVPILPVTIRGGHRIWPSNRIFPRLGRVEIIYHPLFVIEPHEGDDQRAYARRATDALQQIIGNAASANHEPADS